MSSDFQNSGSLMPFVYDFEENAVRVYDRGGEPWFVLADVCRILDIGHAPTVAQRLDEDEKVTVVLNDSHSGQLGGAQSVILINEPGIYATILGSRKVTAEAKRFKRWVTHEVLPTIRKTGSYKAPRRAARSPQPAPRMINGALIRETEKARVAYLSAFPALGVMSRQLVFNRYAGVYGVTDLPEPVVEGGLYDAGKTAKELGVNEHWMVRDHRYQGMKGQEVYGQNTGFAKGYKQSRHEDVTWNWNEHGLATLRSLFAQTAPSKETSAKYLRSNGPTVLNFDDDEEEFSHLV